MRVNQFDLCQNERVDISNVTRITAFAFCAECQSAAIMISNALRYFYGLNISPRSKTLANRVTRSRNSRFILFL